MAKYRTDRSWERWGEQRPYFGVLSAPEFTEVPRGSDTWQRFMASGDEYASYLFDRLERVGAPPRFRRALDFGCGVGRLLPPLAIRSDEVVGVDVSPGMRAEARANLDHLGITNVELVPSDDTLSQVEGRFDLIHSYAVIQHIEVERGLAITRRLLDLAEPGATIALHYCERAETMARKVKRVVGRWETTTRLANRLRGRAPDAPVMQTYSYPLSSVTSLLHERGIEEILVAWGGHGRAKFFELHAVTPR